MSNLQQETPVDQEWVSWPDFERQLFDTSAPLPKAVPLTTSPGAHWFSYYDKFQTDPTDRFVLGMQSMFEDRAPDGRDAITIGMVDTTDENRWIELGSSRAWCWQQGCMLQWRPQSDNAVMWNDRVGDRFVCHVLNVETREQRTIDQPVYHVHPDGRTALTLDFARLHILRPGYGYPGVRCENAEQARPRDSGISLVDLETGVSELLFSVSDIAKIDYNDCDPDDDIHYFNAPAWSPDGSRFLFLHRWRSRRGRFPDFRTRMFTAGVDGGDIRLVTDKPYVSHFTWRDSDHIAMWREDGYKLFRDDGTGKESTILNATNGHLSYVANSDWMVADTYVDAQATQHLYLYNVASGQVVPLGHFKAFGVLTGELRCDLHPRLTRDQKNIIIDSTHGGNGRQMYLLDIPGRVTS